MSVSQSLIHLYSHEYDVAVGCYTWVHAVRLACIHAKFLYHKNVLVSQKYLLSVSLKLWAHYL